MPISKTIPKVIETKSNDAMSFAGILWDSRKQVYGLFVHYVLIIIGRISVSKYLIAEFFWLRVKSRQKSWRLQTPQVSVLESEILFVEILKTTRELILSQVFSIGVNNFETLGQTNFLDIECEKYE
jgi:hypothetical protein